jgi:beta-lactamase regulating signal transducer with metallopeptidase domain
MNAVLHALAPYQSTALALFSYLVTALWTGAAITALAALVLRLWKPLDAAARYAVWYAALIAVALAPFGASFALAHVRVVHASATIAAPAGGPPVRIVHDERSAAAMGRVMPRARIAVPPLLAFGAAALWLLVVLAGAVRFVAGALALARLKRDALPLAPERRAALPLWRAHAGASGARRARLCVSDRVEVPVAVGLFDGMVVLPQHVLDDFEPGDVDRFVLHELAHLERRDDWTTVVQRLVQIVMCFNPAVHVIARRLDLEREIACDDRVVAATSDVRSYAVGLTRMAESTAWPHRGIAAPAIFVTRHQLSLRVEELLTHRRTFARRAAVAPAAVALAASLGVVALAAPLTPHIGVDGAPDAAQKTGALRHVVQSQLFVVDQRGTQQAGLKPGVLLYRTEIDGADRLRAGAPPDAEHVRALLQQLESDLRKHPAEKRTASNERIVVRKLITPAP